jgi:hypothetical protein
MNELMRARLVRSIILCDLIIEDLNCADLDINVHKAITELHRVILAKHQELTATSQRSQSSSVVQEETQEETHRGANQY